MGRLIPQIMPAPPAAACPLKELLLNSKLVKRVSRQRKTRSKKRKSNLPRGKKLTLMERLPYAKNLPSVSPLILTSILGENCYESMLLPKKIRIRNK